MNKFRPSYIFLPLCSLVFLLSISVVASAGLCPNMQEIINSVSTVCADPGANQACVGKFPLIMEDLNGINVATAVGNKLALEQISRIEAQAGANSVEFGGIAKLNVLWDNTVEPTEFLVFGGAQVKQELPTSNIARFAASQLALTATVRTNNNNPANLRSEPGQNGSIAGAIPSGSSVRVLERSADSEWVLVRYSDDEQVTYAWMAMILLDIDPNTIPFSSPNDAPFQSFDVTAITRPSDCQNVPSGGVLLQSPQGSPVHFKVNGVLVYMGSTVLLHPQANGGTRIINLEGNVAVRNQQNAMINIPVGQYIEVNNAAIVSMSTRLIQFSDWQGIYFLTMLLRVDILIPANPVVDIYICHYEMPNHEMFVHADTPIIFYAGHFMNDEQELQQQRSIGAKITLNGEIVKPWSVGAIEEKNLSVINTNTGIRELLRFGYDAYHLAWGIAPGSYTATWIAPWGDTVDCTISVTWSGATIPMNEILMWECGRDSIGTREVDSHFPIVLVHTYSAPRDTFSLEGYRNTQFGGNPVAGSTIFGPYPAEAPCYETEGENGIICTPKHSEGTIFWGGGSSYTIPPQKPGLYRADMQSYVETPYRCDVVVR